MGNEMDESGKNISRKINSICFSLGNIFFWIILRYFLVKKKIIDARTYLFKLTYFQRLRSSYWFCLPSLFSDEEQINKLENTRNNLWSCKNWEKIYFWMFTIRTNWNKFCINDSIYWVCSWSLDGSNWLS